MLHSCNTADSKVTVWEKRRFSAKRRFMSSWYSQPRQMCLVWQ
jgi:hypothetical protein